MSLRYRGLTGIKLDTEEWQRTSCTDQTKCSKKVKQSLYTPWRRLGERRYSSYSFSTSVLDGGEWSASRPGRAFTPWERTPGTHCTGGWVGPRADLDTEDRGKILCSRRGSNPDRPVVQSVVRHYTAWANPAPFKCSTLQNKYCTLYITILRSRQKFKPLYPK
jgi:hypothetical protein